MGIRFLCPNGHKLNVKSFQAGKRGACPHCGARFTIPNESTLPSSKDEREEEVEEQLESPPPVPLQPKDPLAEAPDALWYVSLPDGRQFGPATSNAMRSWIDEGRVSDELLIWREGWEDWAAVSDVLPQSVSGETAPVVTDEAAFPAGPFPQPTDVQPTDDATPPPFPVSEPAEVKISVTAKRSRPVPRPRRSDRDKTAKVVGGLVATVVVLAILLFWVLSRS